MDSHSHSRDSDKADLEQEVIEIDRTKKCPFTIPVHIRVGKPRHRTRRPRSEDPTAKDTVDHSPVDDMDKEDADKGDSSRQVIYLHTWIDATLRELTQMLMRVCPAARQRNARIRYAVRRFRVPRRAAGGLLVSVRKSEEDRKTRLHRLGYVRTYGKSESDEKTLLDSRYRLGEPLFVSIEPWNAVNEAFARQQKQKRDKMVSWRRVEHW